MDVLRALHTEESSATDCADYADQNAQFIRVIRGHGNPGFLTRCAKPGEPKAVLQRCSAVSPHVSLVTC